MDLSLFNIINVFKADYIFNKFKQEDAEIITLAECKLALLYMFGRKIKKKIFIELLKKKDKYIVYLDIDEFKHLCNAILNQHDYVSNYSILLDFYKSISKNSDIDIYIFKVNVREYFPNLQNSFIEDCFVLLDSDSDGKIKLSNLEEYIINK